MEKVAQWMILFYIWMHIVFGIFGIFMIPLCMINFSDHVSQQTTNIVGLTAGILSLIIGIYIGYRILKSKN